MVLVTCQQNNVSGTSDERQRFVPDIMVYEHPLTPEISAIH